METRKTLTERAWLASTFSKMMHNDEFRARAEKVMPKDSDGDYSIIVMAPKEPAVLAFHRMESLDEKTLTLVSSIDGKVHAFFFRRREASSPRPRVQDLPGGLTVEGWLRMAKEHDEPVTYSASGSEFAADLASSELEYA